MLLFAACENDIEEVKAITFDHKHPDMIVENMHTEFTDSGYLQLELDAPVLQQFSDKEDPYTEYPRGIEVVFYNKKRNPHSRLSCEYAVYLENKELWEAKRNVVASNLVKEEKLNTEQLFWDMEEKKIYSDKFVRITTADEILFGQGFESDQSFDSWVIKQPKGSININEDTRQLDSGTNH